MHGLLYYLLREISLLGEVLDLVGTHTVLCSIGVSFQGGGLYIACYRWPPYRELVSILVVS